MPVSNRDLQNFYKLLRIPKANQNAYKNAFHRYNQGGRKNLSTPKRYKNTRSWVNNTASRVRSPTKSAWTRSRAFPRMSKSNNTRYASVKKPWWKLF